MVSTTIKQDFRGFSLLSTQSKVTILLEYGVFFTDYLYGVLQFIYLFIYYTWSVDDLWSVPLHSVRVSSINILQNY